MGPWGVGAREVLQPARISRAPIPCHQVQRLRRHSPCPQRASCLCTGGNGPENHVKGASTEGGAPSLLPREGFPEELTLQQQSSTFKMPLKLCLSVLSPSSEPPSSQVPASTPTYQPNCRPHPRSHVTSMLQALSWLSSLLEQRTETCHHARGPHMPRPALQPHLSTPSSPPSGSPLAPAAPWTQRLSSWFSAWPSPSHPFPSQVILHHATVCVITRSTICICVVIIHPYMFAMRLLVRLRVLAVLELQPFTHLAL